jgi:putative resolvase
MMVDMKLAEWARTKGVSRQSATRWSHAGVLPVAAHQLTTGTVLVEEQAPVAAGVAVYARVSSADQRVDLVRQVARLVEHRDRLARFGAEYFEAALAAERRRLVVVEGAEVTDDLVRGMVEVLTSFCARLYGRRSAKRRAEMAPAADPKTA